MDPIISTAAFIKRNWAGAADWPREAVVPWLAWHAGNGYAAVTRDGRGRINGVGLARPAASAEAGRDDQYHHAAQGPVIFMDLLIARTPPAMLSLWRLLKRRFGMRERVAMQRWKYNGKLIVHSMKRYDQKLEALNHGRI